MAATATFYNKFKEFMGDGTIDLDTDTFKVMLCTSTYSPSASTHTVKADVTNEISGTNGYTTGGYTVSPGTFNESGGTVTFDLADAVWTATGGSLQARYAVLYKSGTANGSTDPLVLYVALDTSDVTAADGNQLKVSWNASGVFTLT